MDTLNDALIACVKAAGGSKQVGPRLWPEKSPDHAQRHLLDCLNPERSQHLTPEQMTFVLGLARDRGFHDGVQFLLAHLGYAQTKPVDPRDEAADLQRQFIESVRLQQNILARLERVSSVRADA